MSGGEAPCRFFDTEGVLLEEAAGDIEAHLAGCAHCQRDQDGGRRAEELRRIPLPPDTGHWEQAVFARIASTEAARRRRRRLFLVVPFLGAALFGIFLWLRHPNARRPSRCWRSTRAAREQMPPAMRPPRRATMWSAPRAWDAPHRQLRVYREAPGWMSSARTSRPARRGRHGLAPRRPSPPRIYRLVLLLGWPLPTATGGPEADIVALRKAASVIEELVGGVLAAQARPSEAHRQFAALGRRLGAAAPVAQGDAPRTPPAGWTRRR